MKNIFIAIAVIASLSACNIVRTNIAVDPNNTEARFCNLNCPFRGIGTGASAHGSGNASASTGASHGVGAAMGGMGHGSNSGGRGTSGNGASSGAAARK